MAVAAVASSSVPICGAAFELARTSSALQLLEQSARRNHLLSDDASISSNVRAVIFIFTPIFKVKVKNLRPQASARMYR